MAKIYKEVNINGKIMKRWLDEYLTFEFDEDGNIVSPDEDDEKRSDYDEKGNLASLHPAFNSEKPKLYSRQIKEEKGNVLVEEGYYKLFDSYKNLVFSIFTYNIFTYYNADEIQCEFDNDKLIHLIFASKEYWFEYDDEKLIHVKAEINKVNCEKWLEYDEGKLIRVKYNDDTEQLFEHNENGKISHKKEFKSGCIPDDWNVSDYEFDEDNWPLEDFDEQYGLYSEETDYTEEYYEYDSNEVLVLIKNSDRETSFKYDEKGNLVCIDYGIYKEIFKYNEAEKLISKKKTSKDGVGWDYSINWDSNGNCIYEEISCISEKNEYKYDNNNNLIYQKNFSHSIFNFEKHWNSNGQLFFYKDSDGNVYFCEQDENGNVTHYKGYDEEEWYEYDFYDNGNVKTKRVFRAI